MGKQEEKWALGLWHPSAPPRERVGTAVCCRDRGILTISEGEGGVGGNEISGRFPRFI